MMKLFRSGRARSLAVGFSLLGFVGGAVVISGCSSSDSVVQDTSGVKNKRTARVDELKGGKVKVPAKKGGP
jgi:hypothetical protein